MASNIIGNYTFLKMLSYFSREVIGMQKTLQVTSACSKRCSLQYESPEYAEFKVS